MRNSRMTSAQISTCKQYRYLLTRPCEVTFPEAGTALFILLNPSTADALADDPTIRRLRGFARDWWAAGITVANLYALRATNPRDLWEHPDPVGPENDACLRALATEYGDAVVGWGNNAKKERAEHVCRIMTEAGARLWCFGTTKSGAPKHPLYVPRSQALVRFEWGPTVYPQHIPNFEEPQ